MWQYDFRAFLNFISHLAYFEMIREAEREGMSVDRALKGIDRQYKDKAIKYRDLLGGFLFLLKYGEKPAGVSDLDFPLFRPAIEKLVEKGQLESTILNLF